MFNRTEKRMKMKATANTATASATATATATNKPLFEQFLESNNFKIELQGQIIENTREIEDGKEVKIQKVLGSEKSQIEFVKNEDTETEIDLLKELIKNRANCTKLCFSQFADAYKGFTISRGLSKLVKSQSKLENVSYSFKVTELKISFIKSNEENYTLLRLKAMTESFKTSLGL